MLSITIHRYTRPDSTAEQITDKPRQQDKPPDTAKPTNKTAPETDHPKPIDRHEPQTVQTVRQDHPAPTTSADTADQARQAVTDTRHGRHAPAVPIIKAAVLLPLIYSNNKPGKITHYQKRHSKPSTPDKPGAVTPAADLLRASIRVHQTRSRHAPEAVNLYRVYLLPYLRGSGAKDNC